MADDQAAKPPASGDDAWNELIAGLGDDVFKDVPDIIASPSPTAASQVTPTPTYDEMDFDTFVPPNPPAVRLSRIKRIGLGCFFGGPVAAYILYKAEIIDNTISGYLSLIVSGAGLYLVIRSLAGRRPDEEASF